MQRKGETLKKTSTLRSAALFVALAMIIQFAAVMLLTPEGLSALYPLAVSGAAEQIVPDLVFDEYYDLKGEFEGSDTFFIGADTTVAESYTAILDLFRFLNRYFGVRILALNIGKTTASRMNDCLAARGVTELEEKLGALRESGIFPNEFITFTRSLATLAASMPLGKEISVESVHVDTPKKATLDKLHSEIISRWASAPKEVTDALTFSDAGTFFEHFHAHAELYRQFLGDDEFARYVEVDEHRVAGDYKEWKIASQLGAFVSSPSLTVVDRDVVGEDSALRPYVEALGAKAAFVGVEYVSCRGLQMGEEVDVHDYSLPFAPERALYLLSARSVEAFTRFCRFVADPTGNGDASIALAPDNYVVVGSPAVKYGEDGR